MADDLKNFILSFFNSLNAEVLWQEETLKVSKVPENFEKFYGKKSPYLFVFDLNHEKEDKELITKGSFLISVVKDYLGSKGQTTLLKIDLDINPLEKINKRLMLKNCKIANVSKNIKYQQIFRFTFITTLQYLNEKEQIIKDVYICNGKEFEFIPEKYQFTEGKKEDIKILDIKPFYVLAKESLQKSTKTKINEIGIKLDNKLKIELDRVKAHYLNQKNENEQVLNKNQQQINELEKNLSLSKDKDNLILKIKRLRESRLDLIKNQDQEKIRKEEDFFIKDEIQKHALNVSNKLLNTTVIYYPIFNISFYLKNQDSARMTNLIYDPLKEEASKFNCEVCNKEINVLNLCSGGHISCNICIRACDECGLEYCKKCLEKNCFSCSKSLCRKCAKKCSFCGKYKCKSHMSSSNICETCKNNKK